jgi:hypothetical protein
VSGGRRKPHTKIEGRRSEQKETFSGDEEKLFVLSWFSSQQNLLRRREKKRERADALSALKNNKLQARQR